MGDIGGLDGSLSVIGLIIASGYNSINAYGILISLLFRKSGKQYIDLRSTMKSKFVSDHKGKEESETFNRFKRNALKYNIKHDI